MSDAILVIGGPKHGKRIAMPDDSYRLAMMRSTERDWLRHMTSDPFAPIDVETVHYEIVRIPVGPGPERLIRAAYHPDITRDTALRVLGDLVMKAWTSYKGDF